jgi:hypothetical protein
MNDDPRHNVATLAQEILDGKVDVLNGCARLVPMLNAAGLRDDLAFTVFTGVWSETDHLPFSADDRRNWAAEALKRKDEEIARAQAFYCDHVLAACRLLISRFRTDSEDQNCEN